MSFVSSAFSQATGDFRTFATGNWNSTATWARFNGTAWINPAPSTPTNADLAITILNTHTVTVTANVSIDQTTVSSGGNITIGPGVTLTVANGTGTDLVISSGGSLTNNGALTLSTSTASNNAGTITNSGTITTTGTLTHAAGSFYQHSFTSATATAGTIPTSTWNATSTCTIVACGNSGSAPGGLSQTFGHFTWNNTTQPVDVNLLGALTTVGGNLTISSTNGFNLNFKTTFTGASTTVSGAFNMNGGNVTLIKVAALNTNYTLSAASFTLTSGTLNIADCSGTLAGNTGNGTLSIGGASTISGGTINICKSTWVGAGGNGTFSSAGLISLTGTAVINGCSSSATGSTGVSGTITATGGITVGSGTTLNMNTSTTTGSGGNFYLNAAGLVTLSGGTIIGSSSATAGTTGCTSAINANLGMTISGGTLNLTPGSITGGGGNGTINISGAAFTVSGGTINLNSSSAIGTTGSNGTINITGGAACNISGSPTITVTSSTTTGGGGSGSLNITGATTSNFSMTGGTFDLCSTSGAGTGNGTLDVDGAFTVSAGTFSISSSTTSAASSGNGTITVGGNFSHTTAAAAFTKTGSASATATITIDGLVAAQTIESTNGFTGTITFNVDQGGVAAAKTTVPNTKTFTVNSGTTFNLNDNSLNTGYDLQIVTGATFKLSGTMNILTLATLDLLGNTITDATTGGGTFNLTTDATLITQHASGITQLASGAVGAIQVTGGRSYSSAANYTYNGSAAQVTGNGLPTFMTGTLSINNTLAPAAGGVTLTQTTLISSPGTLTFGGATNGRLITSSTSLIVLGDDVTVSPNGGTAAKFVDGPIRKIGDDLFIFPTGDVYTATGPVTTAKWARIALATAPLTTTDAFTAEYIKANDPCNVAQVVSSTNAAGIDHVSYKEHWTLTRSSGTSTPTIRLYWETGSSSTSLGSGISSTAAADLHVAECISGTWTDMGAGTVTGTAAGPGTIMSTLTATYSTATTAMPFTFMTPTGVNPLPVELLSFSGYSAAAANVLNWETATETNSSHFTIQRSVDGSTFTDIGRREGYGTTNALHHYEFSDRSPMAGLNYYRLQQVDINAEIRYSEMIAIERGAENTIQVFPNPTSDEVTIISGGDIESMTVYNMKGEIVHTEKASSTKFRPSSNGIYLVKTISPEGKEKTVRFVKK